jgi:uncharacterized membrane protein
MRKLTGLALRGLGIALPVGLTVYFVFWSISNIEQAMQAALHFIGVGDWYVPGSGILIFIAMLLGLGLAAHLLLFRSLLAIVEQVFERIPLIKSVYSAMRDFMDFVSGDSRATGEVVAIEIGGQHMLGIVSDIDMHSALEKALPTGDGLVGVFLPMSYQLGGYTVYVPRSRLTRVDMDAESAMRYIMTAGIGKEVVNSV